MPTRRLPENPSLEHLRGQAKDLRKSSGVSLADAQLATARSYGYPSWPALVAYLDVIKTYTRNTGAMADAPIDTTDPAGLADRFLRLACNSYTDDRPQNSQTAKQLLNDHPELKTATIHTIAAAGDLATAIALLQRNPKLAKESGGPYDWEPLLYLVYSRIARADSVDIARLLLDHGADPDAGYLWRGMPSPFTALTGAFGGGEGDQAPHPDAIPLARLLLEHGADPNDNQTLYNRMFTPQNDHLELLFEFGLGTETDGPWRRRLGDVIPSPTAMVEEQLRWAADHDMIERVRLLLEHGVNPDGLGYHPIYRTSTAYQLATASGNRTIATLLATAGAKIPDQDDVDRLLSACMAGDAVTADAELRARAVERHPDAVVRAAHTRRLAAVQAALDLGAGVNATSKSGHHETALHVAAQDGSLEIAQLLVENGADISARDTSFDGTPEDWAEHCGRPAVKNFLAPLAE